MRHLRDLPLIIFALSLTALWLSTELGFFIRKRLHEVEENEWKDLGTVETATLTLLGLIIAFSFSMAVNRYDLRKHYEAEEANAIGTEYVRAGLLPAGGADHIRDLLQQWLHQRIAFYETRGDRELQPINQRTAQLEIELWSSVQAAAETHSTPTVALAVWGMNDVLNDRAYTQAAWWNRIPAASWGLMTSLAILCTFLVGYGSHRTGRDLFLVLPLAISISFFLIADLDSPHGGIIRILPVDLVSLSESLHSPADAQ